MYLQDGKNGKFYSCSRWPHCSGSHGAHPNGKPLGIPATEETKKARIVAHSALDAYKERFQLTRGAAYKAICRLLKMSRKEGHIGRFDIDTCHRLIDLLNSEAIKRSGTVLPGFKADSTTGRFIQRIDNAIESR